MLILSSWLTLYVYVNAQVVLFTYQYHEMTYCKLKQFYSIATLLGVCMDTCLYLQLRRRNVWNVQKASSVILFDICPRFLYFMCLSFLLAPSIKHSEHKCECKKLNVVQMMMMMMMAMTISRYRFLFSSSRPSIPKLFTFLLSFSNVHNSLLFSNKSWGLRDILTVSLSSSIEIHFNYSTHSLAFDTLIQDYLLYMLLLLTYIIWDPMCTQRH